MKEIRLRIFGEAVIEVGDTEVTPAMSHIFALLLLLTLGPKEGWTRRELMELLFEGVEAKDASHRLRQLLYKLRGMGVELEEGRGRTVRLARTATRLLPQCSDAQRVHDATDVADSIELMPHYHPRHSLAFVEWIDELRDRLYHELRDSLGAALRKAYAEMDWARALYVGRMLLVRDPFNAEALGMTAEALAGHGRSSEALALIDRHLDQYNDNDIAAREIRRIRARLAKLPATSSSPPIRGREELLASMLNCLRSASPVEGTVLLVEGSAGMGKSRLAEALADSLLVRGVPIVRFDCNEQTRHIPLAPFVDVARRLKGMRGALGASPMFKDALNLLTHRQPEAPWPRDESEMAHRRLTIQQALTDLIQAVTAETKTALIIDDAHLLDQASLDLIRTLGEQSCCPAFPILLFLRPEPHIISLLSAAPRTFVVVLPPLSEQACRAVLRDLHNNTLPSDSDIERMLSQAGGNPFYLRLIANNTEALAALPLELSSLAEVTYAQLREHSRLVLEICLLLDTVATLPRLERISGLHPQQLLGALRELEHKALIRLDDGRLLGPHFLLHEALRQAMPTAVKGALHRQIADALTDECVTNNMPALTLAAIQHWLAVRDGTSALALARNCAAQAVSVGEPLTAVTLLDSIPRDALTASDQKRLLEDIIQLSDHARHNTILLSALSERVALAEQLGENASDTANLQLQLIGAEQLLGVSFPGPIGRVRAIATDCSLRPEVRIRAILRLEAMAFLEFDAALAAEGFTLLESMSQEATDNSLRLLRSCASLIFHTTYGSRGEAVALIQELSESYPRPTLDRDTEMARRFAGFAALRLGMRDTARIIFVEELKFAEEVAAFGNAEYAAGVLSDLAIIEGDYAAAEDYLKRVEQIGKRRRVSENAYAPPYFSTAACVAIRRGEFDRALQLLHDVRRTYASMSAPRHRIVTLALDERIRTYRGDVHVRHEEFAELRSLFQRGRSVGGQDMAAESLWRYERHINGPNSASRMLRDYLQLHRRELGPVETDLWLATKSDELWTDPSLASLAPATISLRK